jgi:hypothetical protein
METDPCEYGKMRYHLNDDNLILSSCTGKTSVCMDKGGKVTFTSLLFASDKVQKASIEGIDGKVNVKIEDEIYPTNFNSYIVGKSTKQKAGTLTNTVQEIFKSNSDITAANVFGGKLWIGLSDGSIANIDKSLNVGKVSGINETVHDLCVHDKFIYAGCGNNSIIKITENGDKVWNKKTVRIPTMYPWWELDYPSVMSLRIIKYKGKDTLIAGCGDNNIRYYGLDGNLIGSYYFYAAVPNIIKSYDINNDGKNEIIIAGSIMTCTSIVDILNEEGKFIHRFGDEGWTSIAKVVKCFDINGMKTIALGVNHRNNFKLYQFDPNEKCCKGSYIINDRLAGSVIGIDLDDDNNIIVAATTQGFIVAYNSITGEQKWIKMVNGVISDVKYFNCLFWVADESGNVYAYDKDGILIKTANVKQGILQLKNNNDIMYIITKRNIHII